MKKLIILLSLLICFNFCFSQKGKEVMSAEDVAYINENHNFTWKDKLVNSFKYNNEIMISLGYVLVKSEEKETKIYYGQIIQYGYVLKIWRNCNKKTLLTYKEDITLKIIQLELMYDSEKVTYYMKWCK